MPDEDEIRSVLKDEQRMHIAVFCVEPRSSNEILKSIREVWINYPEHNLATDISELESVQAIVYEENKWKTTDFTKEVLQKYFGHPL